MHGGCENDDADSALKLLTVLNTKHGNARVSSCPCLSDQWGLPTQCNRASPAARATSQDTDDRSADTQGGSYTGYVAD